MFKIENFLDNKNVKSQLFDLMNRCSERALKKLEQKFIEKKNDGSLVTAADHDIDYIIRKKLLLIDGSIPVISEEGHYSEQTFLEEVYWLVDPIDGTSSYVSEENNYTINIALVYQGSPILGIIANPPSNSIWFGYNNQAYVTKDSSIKKLNTAQNKNNIYNIIVSRRYDNDTYNFISKIKKSKVEYCSSSIKFCKISEGLANIYPRLQSISKWDIAAGEAILKAAGGVVLNTDGCFLNYCTKSIKTGKFFALSSKALWKKIIFGALNNSMIN